MTRLIDLSMPVHRDMLTFPRVPPPTLLLYESWTEFAERIGAAQYGVKSLTASYLVITNDHVGTHLDAVHHIVPSAGGPETIPLDYCYSDGVVLDFTDKPKGYGITAADIASEQQVADTFARAAVIERRVDVAPMWTDTFNAALARGA